MSVCVCVCPVKLLSLFVCSSVRGLVAVTVLCHRVLSAICYCNPRIVALLVSQSVLSLVCNLFEVSFYLGQDVRMLGMLLMHELCVLAVFDHFCRRSAVSFFPAPNH